ncbi:hypothetical protein AAFF_G00091370 [Aldrovandia affinis]|uniref:Uncharacterized protein n=1 Tax=Aldrovandia affinis TaxID=143900 RepID=A0AAD7VXW4_9TELE|nr:hypothetical protein AAFF_G00091370 [Aldrovandia affinis]
MLRIRLRAWAQLQLLPQWFPWGHPSQQILLRFRLWILRWPLVRRLGRFLILRWPVARLRSPQLCLRIPGSAGADRVEGLAAAVLVKTTPLPAGVGADSAGGLFNPREAAALSGEQELGTIGDWGDIEDPVGEKDRTGARKRPLSGGDECPKNYKAPPASPVECSNRFGALASIGGGHPLLDSEMEVSAFSPCEVGFGMESMNLPDTPQPVLGKGEL